MVASWSKKIDDVNRILQLIECNITFNADGSMPMNDYVFFSRYFPILNSYLKSDPTITPIEQSSRLEAALFECAKSNSFNAAGILSVVERELRRILQRSSITYYLTTTISIRKASFRQRYMRRIDDVDITITNEYPRKLNTEEWFLEGFGHVNASVPEHYARLFCKVSAKTPHQAADKALKALDLLIASINFTKNIGRMSLIRSGKLRPYNAVRPDRSGTAHHRDVGYAVGSQPNRVPGQNSAKGAGIYKNLVRR